MPDLIPIAFEPAFAASWEEEKVCPILAATQELGLPVTTVTYLRQDVRTLDNPANLWQARNNQNFWYEAGTNHCTVPAKQGHAGGRKVLEGELWISRDMEEQTYCLVHVTHQQLLQLLEATQGIAGKLVLNNFRYSNPAILTLQVGD